ncbi:hypothetical protein ACVI1N_002195 [Sinorhizobium medicae]
MTVRCQEEAGDAGIQVVERDGFQPVRRIAQLRAEEADDRLCGFRPVGDEREEILPADHVAVGGGDGGRIRRSRLTVKQRHFAEERSALVLSQQEFAALRREQRKLDASGNQHDHIIALVAALEDDRPRGPFPVAGDAGELAQGFVIELFENREGPPESGTPDDFGHCYYPCVSPDTRWGVFTLSAHLATEKRL